VQLGALSGVGRQGSDGSRAPHWEIGALGLVTVHSGTIEVAGSSLTEFGPGAVNLTGANLYGAGTVVSEGSLLVKNTAGSATGSGGVVVRDGGGVGGTGFLALGSRALRIVQWGGLAPGNSPGALTVDGDLVLDPGSLFEVDLAIGGVAAAGNRLVWPDRVVVNGGVTMGDALLTGVWGGTLDNAFVAGGTLTSDQLLWVLINDGTDPIDGRFANTRFVSGLASIFGLASDNAYFATIDGQAFAMFYDALYDPSFGSVGFSGGNDLLLIAVPEPGRLLLVVLGLGLLVGRRRR